MKKIIFGLIIIVLVSLSASALAWYAPASAPTGSNSIGPIDQSSTMQSKAGNLALNTGGATYGLLVALGKVGIGTSTPSGIFDVYGTSGTVFTVLADGKIGVGTASPASNFSVSGGVQVGTDSATCTSAKAGTMRWQSSAMQVCNGSSWGNI